MLMKRLIFATSSQGMLPLPSQCNHNSHLRMKGPHIKFPPNLCTRFVKLIAHFVCRDSRKLFALWSGATSPTSATVVKPSRFLADKIASWPPTMLYGGRSGTIDQKTFPPSPWSNSLKVAVFGRTQAIKHYRNALAQHPLKRALLPTLAGKALVCHCLAHEECNADVLVQTYECEVTACAKIPSPVTLQQHYESFAAAPQGFSRSADGGGVHSSGDRPAPRAGIGEIF